MSIRSSNSTSIHSRSSSSNSNLSKMTDAVKIGGLN